MEVETRWSDNANNSSAKMGDASAKEISGHARGDAAD